jgi:hypothetical protein
MDTLLTFSQITLSRGGFFAFVGSSLFIYDFGEVVIQSSGRALREIKFPSSADTMEKKTADFVSESQVFAGAASRQAEMSFFLKVALQVARSSPNMKDWNRIANSRTKVEIPHIVYDIPKEIGPDYVFLLAARMAFGKQREKKFNRERLHAVVDLLHGNADLRPSESNNIHERWPEITVTLSLPPWQLLHFDFEAQHRKFPQVQNWVLVELQRLFYMDGPTDAVKTWELATMGLLELRKAMIQVNEEKNPTLSEVLSGLGVLTKVSKTILRKIATEECAANSYQDLPEGSEACDKPCVFYAQKSNEEGVEGVFRNAYEDLALFFQMKLYHTATPKEISCWLQKAHDHADSLGYKKGSYVVMLFVTDTVVQNLKNNQSAWPQNSMVFADDAIDNLFKPFGDGLFVEMVKSRRRQKQE